MSHPDYLPTLRERFGDDAATREPDDILPDPWAHWADEPDGDPGPVPDDGYPEVV